MCTSIVERRDIAGSGKGSGGWFPLAEAIVSYDHPFHVQLEHAINLDFANHAKGLDARVGVELTVESARELARLLLEVADEADAYEHGVRTA